MPCRFVLTLAGRDMGRVCLTVGVTEDGRMLIADGRTHKLENPKKKQLKHTEKKVQQDQSEVLTNANGAALNILLLLGVKNSALKNVHIKPY